jgi:2,3-bisphosphoglycerate-dependent phosphoglycerate mutase
VSRPRLLFLIRHGRSDESSNDLFEGPRGPQWDPPLDEVGHEQADLLARRLLLMDPRPSAVYCSTLRRARQTIAPYARPAGVDVVYDEDLIEAYIGEWEAASFEEILAADDQMLHRFRNQDAIWRHAPGAETNDQLRARVGGAIERILGRHPEGNVAVVAHGGVINAYVGRILGVEQEMFFLPENTSLNSIEIDGADRRVRFLNDDRHLAQPHLFDWAGEG